MTLTIGDNVTVKSSFLSNLVGLYSHTIIVTRHPEAYIHIGNNVGISGATIYARKGISIGDNCVIGIGVVVSGRFPANSVIVGNPGRVIRTLGERK